MKSISRLKDDARKHELREEWDKAIQVYLQVLQKADGGQQAELELPLYNRIGDLCLRLNRPQEAVRYYEQAADRYADAGLYNNAIALCNKVLRYNPSHLPILRKLGRFSASQGFVTDARRYYTEYADRQIGAGAVDDALAALREFAELCDDAETHELLGTRLEEQGRTAEAVNEFMRAWTLRRRNDDETGAETLRARIAALDPDAVAELRDLPPEDRDEAPSDWVAGDEEAEEDAGFEIVPTSHDPLPEPPAPVTTGLEIEGFETPSLDVPETTTLEGLEATAVDFSDVEVDPSLIEGLDIERDESSFDEPPVADGLVDSGGFVLPTFEEEAGVSDAEGDYALPMPEQDEPAASETGGEFTLPTFDEDEPAEPATVGEFVLPEFETEPEDDDVPESDFVLPTLPADDDDAFALPASEAPAVPDADGEFALPAFEPEPDHDDVPEDDFALPTFEVEPELEGAAEPDGAAEPEVSVEAEYAADPEASAEPEDAAAPEAADQVSPGNVAQGTDTAAHAEADSGWVDLGALVTEEDDEDTTRFTVNEAAPTGDEDRDFAELLSQFKSKVSEHLPPEDAAAHYDLGLAFKEMGLIDEAIAEFQVALRAGHMRLKVCEELGDCFLRKEQYNIAEKVLRTVVSQPHDELELIGVYYHLGRAYEGQGDRDRARDAYERVLAMDIGFGDVSARLARL